MIRIILFGAIAVSGLIVFVVAGGFAYRAYCQNQNAKALSINTPNGVVEEMFVRIRGIDQWVQIRGEDRNNPVLLILHGGPGFSYIPFTQSFRSWEKHFTIVLWDQRGAGKTYGKNGKTGSGTMTIEQMAQDGIEVTEFICKHLKKEKVVLLAHSWGTILGVPMITRRPDLFSAYVGTGQILDMPRNEAASYNLLLNRVRASGDEKAAKALEEIGAPPYKDIKTWMIKGRLAVTHALPSGAGGSLPNVFTAALTAPGYSIKDGYDLFAAFNFSCETLFKEMMSYDAGWYGTEFKIPVFIIQGDTDIQSPSVLAEEFFSAMKAPKKEFVLLKGEGHTALLALPDVFLKELIAKVRPLAN